MVKGKPPREVGRRHFAPFSTDATDATDTTDATDATDVTDSTDNGLHHPLDGVSAHLKYSFC